MASSRSQTSTLEELTDEVKKLSIEDDPTPSIPTREIVLRDFFLFFRNFIYKRPDDFYCNVCYQSVSIPSIMEHINDLDHINVVVGPQEKHNLSKKCGIPVHFCKLLVCNNIFRHGSLLKCYSCELIIESDDKVEDHITSSDHKKETLQFGTAKKAETLTYVGAISKYTASSKLPQESLPDLKNDYFRFFFNYIGEHNDIYVCHACNVKLSSRSVVLSHMNQQHHKDTDALNLPRDESMAHHKHDPNRYRLLVRAGIFPLGYYFWCAPCQNILDVYIAAKNHSRQSEHREMLHNYFISCPEETEQSSVSKTNEEVSSPMYPHAILSECSDDDEKMLTCFICPATQLWRKHKTTEEHQFRERYYRAYFVDSDNNQVFCKFCLIRVHKSILINHASIVHRFIPWYRSPDEFFTYFTNFVQPIDKSYFCHVCKKLNSRWYHAMLHIQSSDHTQFVTGSVIDVKSPQGGLTTDFCEKMATNGVFPYNVKQLKCWTCKIIFRTHHDAQWHIQNHRHIFELQETKSEIIKYFSDSQPPR